MTPLTPDRRALRHARALRAIRPTTPAELHRFVRVVLGIDVTRRVLTPGNAAPFDYLCHAYFEGEAPYARGEYTPGFHSIDAVVWACRGGGKTLLGAVATLLDLVLKPGVQVRILGGSLEQSSKMYEHLAALLDRPLLRPLLAGPPTLRRVVLHDGGRAAILAQSHRSVRGVRVQKLRCDEVDEFDPRLWQAAQMTTRSAELGGRTVRGSVEALSTMHRLAGPMAGLIDGGRARVFRWNAIDVAARCPAELPCDRCALWDDCGGAAKRASGFIPIDDLIAQRCRTDDRVWEAEMMCRRPTAANAVYDRFEPRHHVDGDAVDALAAAVDAVWLGGMDFGLRSPTVMLWAAADRLGADARLAIVDEHVGVGLTLDQNLAAIRAKAVAAERPALRWLAGAARNGQTGRTDVELLRGAGHRVVARPSRIEDGIQRVRRRLDRGTLVIHPRCSQLVAALQAYHFDPADPTAERPVKDGPDHACDALRYLVVALDRAGGAVTIRDY